MLTTLRIRRAHSPVREPVAWFLPGEDPAAWLEEVARWPVSADDIEIYCIAEAGESSASGVLAVPPKGTRVPTGGRAQPFGVAASEIFLPTDAFLSPPADPSELRAAAGFPVLVFHPAHGLTGFEPTDQKRVADFLAAPKLAGDASWSAAREGLTASTPALGAIQAPMQISLADIFGSESDDIGSEAPDELPPSPDESSRSVLGQAGGKIAEGLARGLIGLTSLLPKTSGVPTWANSVQDWAKEKLERLTTGMERERHRELHRLLEMLAKNPEEGLKHAIGLSALAHRGRADPSTHLGRRSLDFDLRRLGGGRAADFWNVPADVQAALAKSYREAAMRELRLGRHRRAACIFAELLGDLAASADALKQGRHFREAALLYRERLHNPLAAARCFAEGGMIPEAIAIYEAQNSWLEAADLHARVGDLVAERTAVRRAVDAHLKARDLLAAARLMETRLASPDDALALLASTWPSGQQAIMCLEERFALLARHKRIDDARKLVMQLGEERIAPGVVAPLTNVLAKIFETASDSRVQFAAAEAVRMKASVALTERVLEKPDELAVLRALVRLAPEDRLLVRDTQRFRDAQPKPAPAARASTPNAPVPKIVFERQPSIELPDDVVWARALADAIGFCVVGHREPDKIVFSRVSWGREIQNLEWTDPAPDRGNLFYLDLHGTAVVVGRPFAPRIEIKSLSATNQFSGSAWSVGRPLWLPDDVVQVQSSQYVLWAVRVVGPRIVLTSYQSERMAESKDVTDELIAAGATGGGTTLTLAAGSAGRVALGYGQHLLIRERSGALRIVDAGARIIGLLEVAGRVSGWIALLERGAAFVPLQQGSLQALDDRLDMPRGVLLSDGRLVLIGEKEGLILQLEPNALKRVAWFECDGPGIAVTRTPHPREVAIFSAEGTVQRWRIPE